MSCAAFGGSLSKPLHGVRVVEFEGLGPGPLAGRMLADMGADVLLVGRPGGLPLSEQLGRGDDQVSLQAGKRREAMDLKSAAGRERALALVAEADALIEGHRPGVMERLGLGPAECAAVRPQLVYGRMTGWGQSGPLAASAGHDLNYVALTGLLGLGAHPGSAPRVPPTVLGDAGGALGLALGMVSALLAVRVGGPGRVVDAAIVDIVAMMGGVALWMRAGGQLDSGAGQSPFHDSPFYDSYVCADGHSITLCALEPQFYALLLHKLGWTDVDPAHQHDRTQWPRLKARLTALLVSQPRTHWCSLLEGSDACFAPVLSLEEAVTHPHVRARGVYRRDDASGAISVAPAPRFLPLQGAGW